MITPASTPPVSAEPQKEVTPAGTPPPETSLPKGTEKVVEALKEAVVSDGEIRNAAKELAGESAKQLAALGAAIVPPVPPAANITDTTDDQPELVYFRKFQLSPPFIVEKKAVPFEALADNIGVIALDPDKDLATIAALNKAAADKRAGVTKIDATRFEELKKKHQPRPVLAQKSSRSDVRIAPTTVPKAKSPLASQPSNGSVAASGKPSSPVGVSGVGNAGGAVVASPAPFAPNVGRRSSPKPIPPLPDAVPK